MDYQSQFIFMQVSIQLPRQPDVDHIPGDDLIVHDDSAVTFTYHQTMSTNLHSLETYKIRAQSGSLTGKLLAIKLAPSICMTEFIIGDI